MVLAWGLIAHAQGTVTITTQPIQPAGVLKDGTAVNLSVSASGASPLHYQWLRNGVRIPGANLPTFSLPRFTLDQGGGISVAVGNTLGIVRSKTIRLVPARNGLPFTDALDPRKIGGTDFPNRITGLSGVGLGSNYLATVERKLGEPLHAGIYGGASMWLVWRPGVNGIATLSTRGSGFDTVLAVYVQADGRLPLDYTNLKQVAANDDAEPFRTSQVQFNTTATATYFIAVDGDGSRPGLFPLKNPVQRGDIVFGWDVESTAQRLPEFSATLKDLNLAPDSGLRLSGAVDFTGADFALYQWYHKDQPLNGVTTPELSFARISPAQVGRYYCRAALNYNQILRPANSPVVDVQIYRRSNNSDSHILAQDKFSIAANYTFDGRAAALSNRRATQASGDRRGLSGVSLGTSGTQIFNTLGAGKDDGEPDHCGESGGASEWYILLAEANGVIIADTLGSDFNTVVAAYEDNGTGIGLFDGLVPVACNNDAPGLGQQSKITFPCVAGRIYYLAVDGVNGATGTAFLNYSLSSQLTLLQAPSGVNVNAGGNAMFQVVAQGVGNLRYQWRRNGMDLPGKTSPVLQLNPAQASDAGNYSVVVTDDLASVTSEAAVLVVNTPPTITAHPAPVAVSPGGTAIFSVAVSGTEPFTFQWLKENNGLGGQTGPTLTLNNVQPGDAGRYSVVVANVAGNVSSQGALLTLQLGATPSLTAAPAPGGQIRILVTGSTGSSYILQQSTDLQNWTPLRTNLSGGFEHFEPPAATPVGRWFRALRR